jgi:hypothetical protein
MLISKACCDFNRSIGLRKMGFCATPGMKPAVHGVQDLGCRGGQ